MADEVTKAQVLLAITEIIIKIGKLQLDDVDRCFTHAQRLFHAWRIARPEKRHVEHSAYPPKGER